VDNRRVSGYDAFADIYEDWAAEMTDDVPFYVELAREADGPIVELAVGGGRVAIPVAQQTGRTVIGIDASPAMLETARERAREAGVELDLRHGDVRELELDAPAALVYCPFRSLLHLPTWADRRRTFERVAAALAPGGRFAWNAFVFDPHVAAYFHGRAAPRGNGIWQYIEYTPADNRLDVTAYTGAPGAEPRRLTLWWVNRSEWEGLVDVAGLEVEALYGWFDRRPFDAESPEFVWIARKPTGA
jgi:SAM-dependent methyltransferase